MQADGAVESTRVIRRFIQRRSRTLVKPCFASLSLSRRHKTYFLLKCKSNKQMQGLLWPRAKRTHPAPYFFNAWIINRLYLPREITCIVGGPIDHVASLLGPVRNRWGTPAPLKLIHPIDSMKNLTQAYIGNSAFVARLEWFWLELRVSGYRNFGAADER